MKLKLKPKIQNEIKVKTRNILKTIITLVAGGSGNLWDTSTMCSSCHSYLVLSKLHRALNQP